MTQTENTQTRSRRRAAFMAPLILVNVGALVGQTLWAYGQLADPSRPWFIWHPAAMVIALAFGLALESISTYLSLRAHDALMADQASGGLRGAAYVVGAVMATLNYSHFASPAMAAPALGIACAAFSLASPWLWAIDSKAAHRAQLATRGIVDPRGVKLSSTRKFWHPVRSLGVVRWAAWAGEVDPELAVAGWESGQSATAPASAEAFVGPVRESIPLAIEQTVDSPVLAIEQSVDSDSATESVTETVTETVTQTRTRTQSTSIERRIQTLRARVQSVRSAHPDWQSVPLSYDAIGQVIGRTGREVIRPVYAVLYLGESVESALAVKTVDGTVNRATV